MRIGISMISYLIQYCYLIYGHLYNDNKLACNRTERRETSMQKESSVEKSLLFLYPALAAQWHPTKNGELTPNMISAGSGKKVWWIDSHGHEWSSTVHNRTKGSGCPFCGGKLPIKGQTDLATRNPTLASEWHPTKNMPLTPEDVKEFSNRKVWWMCSKGHVWQEQVANRSNGNGCPYCSNKRVLTGYNDLQTLYPNLAGEWHPTKNGDLSPALISAGSKKKVWWRDQYNHEWIASVYSRAAGSGCPYCSGKLPITGKTDLATTNPSLASEWHPSKNKPLTPENIKEHSDKKVWWICSKGHEWQEQVYNRSNGNGCPYCSGKKVLAGYNDLQTTYPDLASEWHPTKNGTLTPDKVSAGAEKKIWWLGKCGHEWQSLLYSRKVGRGCPVCRGLMVLKGFNDLASQKPEIASEWHPTKNNGLMPDAITTMSEKKIWWLCKYGHEWMASVATRSQGHGCPICARRFHTSLPEQTVFFYLSQVFPDAINSYRDIFDNKMELDVFLPSISTAVEYDGVAWHKRNNKYTSDKRKYAICHENGIRLIRIREFKEDNDSKICDAVICINPNPSYAELDGMLHTLFQTIAVFEPDISTERDINEIRHSFMQVMKNNSLAQKYPIIAQQWHPIRNGKLTPDMFAARSNERVWWMCEKGHEWQASPKDRVGGYGCPYCSNQKILAGYNDLATTNPELAKEWHPTKNGDLTPQMIPAGTEKKVWWICKNGHEWQATVYRRNKGSSCPACSRRMEKEV